MQRYRFPEYEKRYRDLVEGSCEPEEEEFELLATGGSGEEGDSDGHFLNSESLGASGGDGLLPKPELEEELEPELEEVFSDSCSSEHLGSEKLKISETDPAIEAACIDLRTSMSREGYRAGLNAKVNYSDPACQDAYLAMYVGTNLVGIVAQLNILWEKSSIFRGWLKYRETINVCSIGGGPGTDLLGLGMFFENWDMENYVEGSVFDLHNWKTKFECLSNRLESQHVALNIDHISFDLFKPISSDARFMFQAADMITMVKFVSSIVEDDTRQVCKGRLQSLLAHMKPGSLLFFVDNSGGRMFELVWAVSKMCDLKLIEQNLHDSVEYWPELVERLRLDRNCCRNCAPQRFTNVSSALYQKC